MLKHELLRDEGILIVTPEAPLEAGDFRELNREVDPYIAETGKLNGLLIYAATFPSWETFAAFISHLKFIKEHHQKIDKVAVVTDSDFLRTLPRITSHFVQAETRHFALHNREMAIEWLKSGAG